ncbi:hypothetical protein Tco_1074623 [Tanacetum coccineum]
MSLWYSKDTEICPQQQHIAMQMPTTRDVKTLDVVHREALSSEVTIWLAGHPGSKNAWPSRVQRLNIFPYMGVDQVETGVMEFYFVRTEYQSSSNLLPREEI